MERPTRPDFDRLFEVAAAQDGLFTLRQAALAGYSPQLLNHHVRAGRMRRVRRGIYRLVHFPAGEHEELTVIWLWADRAAVFSHETALAMHDLSTALPARVHLTLPDSWRKRRLRIPEGVVLHHGEVEETDRWWFGPVPATTPLRTLLDCATAGLSPDLLREAALDALERGLVSRRDLGEVESALEPFGGLLP